MSKKEKKKYKISAQSFRELANQERIFNKAVKKAVEENRKAGISDEDVYNIYKKS